MGFGIEIIAEQQHVRQVAGVLTSLGERVVVPVRELPTYASGSSRDAEVENCADAAPQLLDLLEGEVLDLLLLVSSYEGFAEVLDPLDLRTGFVPGDNGELCFCGSAHGAP